ncbi:hypothetical protein [Stenomitos frigidus]|uniref:hypothetical protein n=1 Tax=Stenomitos frigidus TaxID=1886765 RepID=UPI001C633D31|nr:hypothetical protein [Stenomitos frigidus]
MNRKLVSSLIAATTLFTSVLPAFAGEQQSWINGDTLAKDPRALCSDVGLGSNTQNNNGSSSSSTRNAAANSNSASGASSNSQSSNSTHSAGGGGGFSFLGIGASGSGSSKGSNSSSASNSNRYAQASASSQSSASSRANAFNRDSSTVVTGKNCDAFVGAAAARDIAHDDNVTARYGIDAQVKINDSNNQTAVQLLNSQRRSGAVSNLTQWYSPQR